MYLEKLQETEIVAVTACTSSQDFIELIDIVFIDFTYSELQIRGSTEDNSKIIFLISQQKYML